MHFFAVYSNRNRNMKLDIREYISQIGLVLHARHYRIQT